MELIWGNGLPHQTDYYPTSWDRPKWAVAMSIATTAAATAGCCCLCFSCFDYPVYKIILDIFCGVTNWWGKDYPTKK